MEYQWTIGDRSSRGQGMIVHYAITSMNPFGTVLMAATCKGLCYLGLPIAGSFDKALHSMRHHFPSAEFVERQTMDMPQIIDAHGTSIQIAVWRQLVRIPDGQTKTYKDIATAIGQPKAARAVGGAIGSNPVTILIPCHRVIASNGRMQGFAWGIEWKEKLLTGE